MRVRVAAVTMACVFWMVGCTRPGEGEKAKAGFNSAQPVITALARFHEKRGEYPAELKALVPEYLAKGSWDASVDGKPVGEYFRYEKAGVSYRLQFDYSGPGMNRCVYTPEAAKWECAGKY